MRKFISAIAMGALAAGLLAAPSAIAAPKPPKPVPGTVSVAVDPTTITAATTSVTASGNIQATDSCRKDRTLRFSYVNTGTAGVTPLAETAVSQSNGDFSVVLPKPADAAPAQVVLHVTVDQVLRKGGKKGKGRRHDCLEINQDSAPLTISP